MIRLLSPPAPDFCHHVLQNRHADGAHGKYSTLAIRYGTNASSIKMMAIVTQQHSMMAMMDLLVSVRFTIHMHKVLLAISVVIPSQISPHRCTR